MDKDEKTTQELAADVKKSFDQSVDKVKNLAETALGEAKKSGEISTKLKADADEALIKMNGLREQLEGLEQLVAQGVVAGAKDDIKSFGTQFIENDDVKSFLDQSNPKGSIDFEIKATLTSLTGDVAGAVGDAISPHRLSGIQALPQRRMTVRDLISSGQTSSSAIEYVQETGFTNNAGMVAENTAKPVSDIKFDMLSVPTRVIAHIMKASRQVLDDIPQLQSIVDQRLLYGLAYKEEVQLLNGDGTGQNLLGIIPQATAYSAPAPLVASNSIDVMRLSMLQAVLAEYPATAHVMNPIDWAWLEILKDANGEYIIGNPQGSTPPTLWGLPVVTTQAMTVDKFLTGAFKLGAQVFDRWKSRIEIATQNEDDFKCNRIAVLAEERLALAVYRPEAFIYGDFGRIA